MKKRRSTVRKGMKGIDLMNLMKIYMKGWLMSR